MINDFPMWMPGDVLQSDQRFLTDRVVGPCVGNAVDAGIGGDFLRT